ncbi:MAG: permease prefix domain 1-containing protein [Planctomycetota bacterium]
MPIQHVVRQVMPTAALQSAADIEADIRDELEFHLAMRTDENVRDGMSAEAARRDAEQRVGNFEASRRACQKIDLGPRIWMQRLQLSALVLLIATVLYQAILLTQTRAKNADQIEALTLTIQQLQDASHRETTAEETMPYLRWVPDVADRENARSLAALEEWNRFRDVLSTPWCDWHALMQEAESQ